jgi:hypothetical protein
MLWVGLNFLAVMLFTRGLDDQIPPTSCFLFLFCSVKKSLNFKSQLNFSNKLDNEGFYLRGLSCGIFLVSFIFSCQCFIFLESKTGFSTIQAFQHHTSLANFITANVSVDTQITSWIWCERCRIKLEKVLNWIPTSLACTSCQLFNICFKI